MEEQWTIHRAGLLNFWYYDEQEFFFSDGRLLLRGSNGSGKSVTMQSFIPLLLDGNKNPERLDPFGSRARKMENYLLGENEELEERTGYLYMEFKKPGTENYITIGMGLRARKSKKLDSWGFSITDGRRIGHDFYLYKEMGEKIPLSQKELENRIGTGGKVCNTQRDYMDMVNRLLYGFETIEDYDELVKLLVQLRTPKLSKDFRPSVLYDIMTNSLQTLSDEDLRPMSEAIENMDNIKSHLETLEQSKKAGDKVKNAYDQYNRYVLGEKARDLIQANMELNKLEKQEKELREQMKQYEEQYKDAHEKGEELQLQQKILDQKKEELQKHDGFKLKKELDELQIDLRKLKEQENRKQEKIDQKKGRERDLYDQLRKGKGEAELQKKRLTEVLEEMTDLSEEFLFDEQAFLEDELRKDMDTPYDFGYIKTQFKTYGDQVQKALHTLREEARRNKDHDEKLLQLDRAKRQREQRRKELEEADTLLLETKEEFIEKMYQWEKSNTVLKISKEIMIEAANGIQQYGPTTTYDDILTPVRRAYGTIEQELIREKSNQEVQARQQQEELDRIEEEIREWKNKKDPEPPKEEKILRNRERLEKSGIPYIPLYKAIDFKEETQEALGGILEEALLDMGLLDALIIPEKYRDQVLNMDLGMGDRYIFTTPHYLQYELSHLLKPEKLEGGKISLEEVDNVLKSILLDSNGQAPYITEKGEYGLGILKGKVTRTYEPKYVGIQARKRYRESMIAERMTQKEEGERLLQEIHRIMEGIERKHTALQKEFGLFPAKQDLETAWRHYERTAMNLDLAQKEVKNKEEEAKIAYDLLQEVRRQLRELTEKLNLPLQVEAYQQAIEDMGQYREMLMNLESSHIKYLGQLGQVQSLDNQIQDVEADIEELLYDFGKLQQQITEKKKREESCQEQLAMTDYEQIKKEIDHCLEQLRNLPAAIIRETERKTEAQTSLTHTKEKEKEIKEQLQYQQSLYAVYEQGFREEYHLGYVEEPDPSKDILPLARNIYSISREMQGMGKQREDYAETLQQRYFENRSYLVEYNVIYKNIFEYVPIEEESEGIQEAKSRQRRLELMAKIQGKEVRFLQLVQILEDQIEEHKKLLRESDRQLFEDILANTISKKIRAKIYHSEQWVRKMNDLMESMNTSSGLSFSLSWKSKKAETEEQLGTKELVDLLKIDAHLLREEDLGKLSRHFRSKIEEARKEMEEGGRTQTFHRIMKEVLDYRQWFEFQLFYTKTGERKRELTNNAFDTFSGGEKAMAMYVPLFSSVYARYEGARKDCPRIISLDEAFAGVDENNIRDMFRLMIELKLSFVINSQILWGDYDTVPSLAIQELLRPDNAKCVSVLRYHWNGKVKKLILKKENTEHDQAVG